MPRDSDTLERLEIQLQELPEALYIRGARVLAGV